MRRRLNGLVDMMGIFGYDTALQEAKAAMHSDGQMHRRLFANAETQVGERGERGRGFQGEDC